MSLAIIPIVTMFIFLVSMAFLKSEDITISQKRNISIISGLSLCFILVFSFFILVEDYKYKQMSSQFHEKRILLEDNMYEQGMEGIKNNLEIINVMLEINKINIASQGEKA